MAILVALAAACAFGAAPVLQQSVAAGAPERLEMSPRLLLYLARRPRWLLGICTMVVGSALQALALYLAALTFIEPLLATNVIFAVTFTAIRDRRWPRLQDALAAIAVSAGVALLLVGLRPHGGHPSTGAGTWLTASLAVGLFLVLAVTGARFARGVTRAVVLGAATGAGLGLEDAMNRASTHLIGALGLGALSHWQPWGVLAIGAIAFSLQQFAHRAGSVPGSQPPLTVTQAMVSMAFGAFAFGEGLRTSPGALALGAIGAAAAVLGIVVLSQSPLARRETTLVAQAEHDIRELAREERTARREATGG